MSPNAKKLVMLAAVAAAAYAMLRSTSASAADGPIGASSQAQDTGQSLGQKLSSAVSSALDSVYDSVISSPGVASTGGSSSGGSSSQLPVSGVTQVEDPARVQSAIDSTYNPYRDPNSDVYGYSKDGNRATKQMNSD